MKPKIWMSHISTPLFLWCCWGNNGFSRHSLDFSASSPLSASTKYAGFRGAMWGFLGSCKVRLICYLAMLGLEEGSQFLVISFLGKEKTVPNRNYAQFLPLCRRNYVSNFSVASASLRIRWHFNLKLILVHFCPFNLVLLLPRSLLLLTRWN